MANQCRDCSKCSRLGIVKLIYIIPKIFYYALFSWNIGLFQRKCPDCGHSMKSHLKRADGSFAD